MPGIVTQTSAVTLAIVASMGWWRAPPMMMPSQPVAELELAGDGPEAPLSTRTDANLTGVDDIAPEPLSQQSPAPFEDSAPKSAQLPRVPQSPSAAEGDVDSATDAPVKLAHGLDPAGSERRTGAGVEVAACAAGALLAVVAAAAVLRRAPASARECPGETLVAEAEVAELDRTGRCEEYTVTVDLSAGEPLGISTRLMSSSLAVTGVGRGLLQEWNLENPRCKVKVGDHLVEMNGFLGQSSVQQMSKQLLKKQIAKMKFCRMVPKLRVSGVTPPPSPTKAVPQRKDVVDQQICIPVLSPLTTLPVEEVSAGNWYIKNVYEQQAVKVGLRRLNEIWDTLNVTEASPTTQQGKTPYLIKKNLLVSLADGKREIQAVPGADLAPAQSDLKHLPLRVLLQIRVRCLDMTFNGEIQQAFISILDSVLLAKIGQVTIGRTEHGVVNGLGDGRFGQRAMIFLGASTAISSSSQWCWPLEEGRRTFFDAASLTCSDAFPAGGALEVRDYSKADPNDASGVRRWMDWQVRHVAKEMHLKADAPKAPAPAGPMEVSEDQLRDSLQRLRPCGDA